MPTKKSIDMKNKKSKNHSSDKKKLQKNEEDDNIQDLEDDEDYDEEQDSEDANFIAKDDEVEDEIRHQKHREKQELKRQEKKQRKKERRAREKNSDDDNLDDDDYDLLHENRVRQRKLKKLGKEESDEEQDLDQDEKIVKKENFRPEKLVKQQIFDQKNRQDSTAADEELNAQNLKDKFITEDIDDLFGTPQDLDITEKDVPERLQIKLQNRLNPTDQELEQESEWVFDIMMDSLHQNKNQSFSSKIQEVKKKICKVLKFFRCESFDIPYITKYRFNEVDPELTQADVWRIFNLDIEYGKFLIQKKQCEDFFTKLSEFGNNNNNHLQMQTYKNQIFYTKTQRDLNDFQPLINFYKQYYQKELETVIINSGKKLPVQKKEFVSKARQQRLDEFSKRCMLGPLHLVENIQEEKQVHLPPQPLNIGPNEMARDYMRADQKEPIDVIKDMCVFTAIELAAQPDIRRGLKKHIQEFGIIITHPTDKGFKELDVFHPSYRVKRVEMKISELKESDLFLDIIQNEALDLITFNIVIKDDCADERLGNKWLEKMLEMFKFPDDSTKWKFVRKEIFEIFTNNGSSGNLARGSNKCFLSSILDEIKAELKEDSENNVLKECGTTYQTLINTGYFKINEPSIKEVQNESRKLIEEDIIPQRERLVVMGAIMHSIDSRNFMTTIAVVNEFGDLMHHKDFLYLIPPRKPRPRDDGTAPELRPGQIEEQKKHHEDKAQFQNILREYNVSLISVAADCLEAKRLKRALGEMAKYSGEQEGDDDNDAQMDNGLQKEAFVIWGKPEVPKLFAQSHFSQKLLKNHPFILKKAICLARFEQDPMNEILNLWSPIMSENQSLNLDLHPLQKHVNQARLADTLEEVNIKTVNNVGIDINLLAEHDHWHNQLQFLSGLGPRKAQRYIQRLKQLGKPLYTRNEIYETKILKKYCFISCFGYTKVYVAPEKRPTDFNRLYNILDQTRIHYRNYDQVYKIVTDCVYEDQQDIDKAKKSQAVNEIIKNPQKLKQFAFGDYKEQIKKLDMNNIRQIFDQIIEDLINPFKDPREALEVVRTPEMLHFKNEELFYCLIDESPRTFKEGMIVSATVSRVFEGEKGCRIACRLENGMDGSIREENCEFFKNGAPSVDTGSIVTGRIYSIQFEGPKDNPDIKFEDNFSVNLTCKQSDLRNHSIFLNTKGISLSEYHEDDLVNQNMKIQEEHTQNAQKPQIQKRKIQHQRFQNISSSMALQFLKKEDNGEFYFRPSSQGNDHLTLTWKFYEDNIVHIDIKELDKAIGANIGSKLQISDEFYENLQEIVERYITPCNRSIREILQHPKFLKCIGTDDLKKALDQEKLEDSARIPYRFTIYKDYPQYVVMGYIPKKDLVKEFIKVKPRGYFFHHQYHYPFQNMINWFKQEFRTRDYQRYVRKAQSPKQVIGRQAPVKENALIPKGGMDIQQENGNWQGAGGGFKQENVQRNSAGGGGWGDDSQSNVKDEREKRNGGDGGGWGDDNAGGGGNNWGGGEEEEDEDKEVL